MTNEVIHSSEWGKEVDALGHSHLQDISAKMFSVRNETVKVLAVAQIEMGRLLLKARKEFKGDLEFGRWREGQTPINSRQTAHNLMKLAEQSGTGRISDKLIKALPTSTLAELISAPDSVLNAVNLKVEQGETVTAKDIREEKKEAKKADAPAAPTEISNPSKATIHAAGVQRAEDVLVGQKREDTEVLINSIVELDVHEAIQAFVEKQGDINIKKAMTENWAIVLYGVCPYSDSVPRWQVFELMRAAYESDESIKKWEMDTLDAAFAKLTKMYNK